GRRWTGRRPKPRTRWRRDYWSRATTGGWPSVVRGVERAAIGAAPRLRDAYEAYRPLQADPLPHLVRGHQRTGSGRRPPAGVVIDCLRSVASTALAAGTRGRRAPFRNRRCGVELRDVRDLLVRHRRRWWCPWWCRGGLRWPFG